MDSNIYDQLMVKTLSNTHIKDGTVYYDDVYEQALKDSLTKYGLLNNYRGELSHNSQGAKMCSIASSSRFCFLASKTIMKEIDDHEKTDLKNGCCIPHFDGYASKHNIFYEFKCHEFCSRNGSVSHTKLTSFDYIPLLKDIFDIDCKDPSELKFSDFGLVIDNDPQITKINFDFKQFVCHIIGLLSIATKKDKPTLNYVWIVPDQPDNKELASFISFVKEQIDDIFAQTSELEIRTTHERGKLKEFINFSLNIIPATAIKDFVLESIK